MANYIIHNGELYHYGVPGMKWGVRKAADLARRSGRFLINTADRVSQRVDGRQASGANRSGKVSPVVNRNIDPHKARIEKAKKAVKIGAVVAGAALAVYGTMKLNDALNRFHNEQNRRAIEKIIRAHDVSYQRYWLSQQR